MSGASRSAQRSNSKSRQGRYGNACVDIVRLVEDELGRGRARLKARRRSPGVLTAIVHALIWFKPSEGRDEQFFFYHSTAEEIINEIRSADPSQPITKRSTRQHAMAMLKDKLGVT